MRQIFRNPKLFIYHKNHCCNSVADIKGASVQSAPRCHPVGEFSAKVAEQKLNTSFLNKKIIALPKVQSHANLFLLKKKCKWGQSIST